MATFPTLYDLLHLPATATAEQIEDAYQEWVLGDASDDDPEAVRQAFELLRNADRRRQYDEQMRIATAALTFIDAANAVMDTNPVEAVRLARRAVEIAPEQATPRYTLTNALLAVNDVAGAEAELRGLITTSPDEAFARFMLARFLLNQERRPDAEAELLKVLERAPEHRGALMLLALISRDSGRYELAIELLERAILADGVEDWHDTDALMDLLIVHALRDNLSDFRSAVERIQAAAPPEPDTTNDLAQRLLTLAVEFFKARAFDFSRETWRAIRPNWVNDPLLEDQYDQIGSPIVHAAEAAAMAVDSRITAPLKHYAAIRYVPNEQATDDTRRSIIHALQHEALDHPDAATELYDYVEETYPAFTEDNEEFLDALRRLVAESLPPDEE